jgi:hypothetical protein
MTRDTLRRHIGLAEEVKRAFKVKWLNEADPAKGYQYIFVDEDDYAALGPEGRNSLVAVRVPGDELGRHFDDLDVAVVDGLARPVHADVDMT